MATVTINRPWLKQSDWIPKQPAYESLDSENVDIIFDLDLDELIVHYYGRSRRHTVHPTTEFTSALIDPVTGELVGIMFNQFLRKVAPGNPNLLGVLRFATVLSGDTIGTVTVEHKTTHSDAREGLRSRAARAIDVLLGRNSDATEDDKLRVLRNLGVGPILC